MPDLRAIDEANELITTIAAIISEQPPTAHPREYAPILSSKMKESAKCIRLLKGLLSNENLTDQQRSQISAAIRDLENEIGNGRRALTKPLSKKVEPPASRSPF